MESKEDRYHLLIKHLQDPIAYYQIKEKNGKPVDFIFLDMNLSFERMIGCPREQLMGQRMTEVFLVNERFDFDWFIVYSQVALTGETTCFEQYFQGLKKWYHIALYIDNRGCLTSLFQDTTDKRRKEEKTKELSCLYSISRILRNEKDNLDRVLNEVVALIPAVFHDPPNIGVCITLKHREYKTSNYQKTTMRQTYPMVAYGITVGSIEVCYLYAPLQDEDPFLKEERRMINTVAELLSSAMEQRQRRINAR